jgi:hypothetical protein
VLDEAVPPQEFLNLMQVGLEVFELLLRAVGFDHAILPFAVNWLPGFAADNARRAARGSGDSSSRLYDER